MQGHCSLAASREPSADNGPPRMQTTTAQPDPSHARYALSIGGKVYGPYAASQMRAYIAEGRVTAASVISRDGGAWMPASDDPFCAGLLPAGPQPSPPAPPAAAARTSSAAVREAFLKELQGVRMAKPAFAADPASPAAGPVRPVQADPIAVAPAEEAHDSANYLIVFDLKSRGHTRLEEAIMALGPATQVMSGVWVLHSHLTSGAIRNNLVKHFGATDSLFIVDASRDRTTWFNLGPEADAHIRKVWRRS